MKSKLSKFIIYKNQNCPCGSKLKYKRCCEPILKEYEHTHKIARKKYKEKKYNEAIKFGRAHLTQYIIWYNEHTKPFYNDRPLEAKTIFAIDIEALSAATEFLLYCYQRTNKLHDFNNVLHSIENIIDHESWKNRVIYLNALWNIKLGKPETHIREIILSLKNIIDIDDTEILKLYLDVCQDKLSNIDLIYVLDKILKKEENKILVFKYRSTKGRTHILTGNQENGLKEMRDALKEYEPYLNKASTIFEYWEYAYFSSLYGYFAENEKYLKDSITYYNKILDNDIITNKDKSLTYNSIGQIYAHLADWKESIKSYKQSLNYDNNWHAKLLLVIPLIKLNDIDGALEYVNQVEYDDLPEHGKLDYTFLYSKIAIYSRKEDHIKKAINLLEQSQPKYSYFKDTKNDIMMQLLKKDYETPKNKKKGILRHINETFILQPNLFGLGVNLNKLFEKMSKRKLEISKN